jgi:hypothetical protein
MHTKLCGQRCSWGRQQSRWRCGGKTLPCCNNTVPQIFPYFAHCLPTVTPVHTAMSEQSPPPPPRLCFPSMWVNRQRCSMSSHRPSRLDVSCICMNHSVLQNHWVSGLCPPSGILLDLFPSSGEGRETPTLLGALERANLNHPDDDQSPETR